MPVQILSHLNTDTSPRVSFQGLHAIFYHCKTDPEIPLLLGHLELCRDICSTKMLLTKHVKQASVLSITVSFLMNGNANSVF